jgi:hypothetical protein
MPRRVSPPAAVTIATGFDLALLADVRADHEQAELERLAVWLDAQDATPRHRLRTARVTWIPKR